MELLLRISRVIDAVTERVGRAVFWLVLVAALVSSLNAMVRYTFSTSSNALLEIQWYLFGAIFLLCAGYTLKHEGHVRIDVLYGKYSRRAQLWVDILGTLFFLLPMTAIITVMSWPAFLQAFQSNEMSSDAGGLLRWPIRLMIPIGFALLTLQGISELFKRLHELGNPGEKAAGGHQGSV